MDPGRVRKPEQTQNIRNNNYNVTIEKGSRREWSYG